MSAANFLELSIVIEGQIGPNAGRQCDVFFRKADIIIEPFTVEQAHLARRAFPDFGKGCYAAGLNFGDCFAYALAKITGEPTISSQDHQVLFHVATHWRSPARFPLLMARIFSLADRPGPTA
jgi:ribonuclease VapC